MNWASYLLSLCLHLAVFLLIMFWPSSPPVNLETPPVMISLVDGAPGGNRTPSSILGKMGKPTDGPKDVSPPAKKADAAAPERPEVKADPTVDKARPVEAKPEPKVERKPEPKHEVKPKPEPKPVPRPRSRMEIPKDAAKKNDLTFLEGCWRSRTDLFNTRGEPIEGEYCFNKKGQGRRFVYERNGQRCSGAARARFNGNQLVIEAPEAACPRGGVYVPQSVNCTGTGASTECRGREHSRRSNTWKATFTRK